MPLLAADIEPASLDEQPKVARPAGSHQTEGAGTLPGVMPRRIKRPFRRQP